MEMEESSYCVRRLSATLVLSHKVALSRDLPVVTKTTRQRVIKTATSSSAILLPLQP